MDFLVYKFSEWLDSCRINHKLIHSGRDYYLYFLPPDDNLKYLLSRITISIDTTDEYKEIAIREDKPVLEYGKIHFTKKNTSLILNAIYSPIRDYITSKI